MRIKVEGDSLVNLLKPEWKTREVELTALEIKALKTAQAICDKAADLQAKINEKESIPEEYNDFEWAAIYLRDILSYCQ